MQRRPPVIASHPLSDGGEERTARVEARQREQEGDRWNVHNNAGQ